MQLADFRVKTKANIFQERMGSLVVQQRCARLNCTCAEFKVRTPPILANQGPHTPIFCGPGHPEARTPVHHCTRGPAWDGYALLATDAGVLHSLGAVRWYVLEFKKKYDNRWVARSQISESSRKTVGRRFLNVRKFTRTLDARSQTLRNAGKTNCA